MTTEPLYPVPALAPGEIHRAEQTIKRSRFICSVAHAASPEEAKTFIEAVSREFSDARHNCWAFASGAPGSTARIGASDAGEPHGTAGRPMLNVLLHSGVGEIAVVVTRYFGGILLGTGGLVRAYQGTVQLALETLPTAERLVTVPLDVTIEHRFVTLFLRLLPKHRASVTGSSFGLDAEYRLAIPEPEIDPFSRELTEITSGGALISRPEKGTQP
ncbi:MAG: YigZ family protein [Sutterellaceae bacterium]|nr:YigZ family protein [Sutterellaceae bacterium]MDY2868059.1 YigZ family protein [Mesosutterella sp.]